MLAHWNCCVWGRRTQPLICVGFSVHYWVPCATNNGGFFEIAFVVVLDTHLPRFEALAYVLPHFDELTHVVIRASSSVCWGLLFCLRKAFIFKHLLNLCKAYIFQGFAESFKTFIFQKFRRPLCHKVNLPRCEARRRCFIMTCDIFGTGQTNILGLCHLFGKTYKQPTVASFNSSHWNQHTPRPNYCTYWDGAYDITSLQRFFIMIHRLNRSFAVSIPYV